MQLGSIWGHGGYVAPDWTADWLHRELIGVLDIAAAREFGARDYAALNEEQKSALQGRLRLMIRRNTYDPGTGTITVSQDRAQATFAWFVVSLWLRPRREPHEVDTAANDVEGEAAAQAA